MARSSENRSNRPPLESVREAPFSLVRDSQDGDGLTLDGYGAVFNTVTVIDSFEGRFKEQISNGAMKRSFKETPPKIQFDHGRHPMIGSIPIASLRSASEDTNPVLAPNGGAHIIARVFDNWLTQPVRDAIAEDAINGMSFRFSVLRESWTYADGSSIRNENDLINELNRCMFDDVSEDDLPVRTLRELKVPEVGPVVWPAYPETSVSMRSKIIDLGRLDDPEQRKLLARAVYMADSVEPSTNVASGNEMVRSDSVGDEEPSVIDSELPDDSQRDTDNVVERQSQQEDAQQDTVNVVEHPSRTRTYSDKQLKLMNQRDRLLTLRPIGERP